MAYIVPADFRTATAAWFTQGGLTLDTSEATDAQLTAAIAARSEDFDRYTNDHFEPEPASTPAAPPAPPSGTVAAGSGVDAGTHQYVHTYLVNGAESAVSANSVTVTTTSANGQVNVTGITAGPTGTTARRLYRSKAGTTSPLYLVGEIADNTTTTFTDTVTDDSLGPAPAPGNLYLDVRGSGEENIYLPKRIRRVTWVGTRSTPSGAVTVLPTSAYETVQSLDTSGLPNPVRGTWDLDIIRLTPYTSASDGGLYYPVGYLGRFPLGAAAIRIVGLFSWAAVPGAVQRAVAKMVWHSMKAMGAMVNWGVETYSTADATYNMGNSRPTGDPEVDKTIAEFTRRLPPRGLISARMQATPVTSRSALPLP